MKSIHFVVVVTAHRALHFAERCLESVKWQVGKHNIDLVYRDDASGYNRDELAYLHHLVEDAGGQLVCSVERKYQIGSLDSIIRQVGTAQSVICELDGDDYLLPHALRTIANAYADPDVAATYGNTLVDFRPFQDLQYFGRDKCFTNTIYPEEVWRDCSFRRDEFRCFHLRTFCRWLWDRIDPAHFRRPDGSYFRGSGDSAFMYPILEMLADSRHVRFIDEPVYVYRLHDRNVWRVDKPSQASDFAYIRERLRPYSPLDRELLTDLLAGRAV